MEMVIKRALCTHPRPRGHREVYVNRHGAITTQNGTLRVPKGMPPTSSSKVPALCLSFPFCPMPILSV